MQTMERGSSSSTTIHHSLLQVYSQQESFLPSSSAVTLGTVDAAELGGCGLSCDQETNPLSHYCTNNKALTSTMTIATSEEQDVVTSKKRKHEYVVVATATASSQEELVLILTNHLWAENTEDVARAMQKLCDILNRDDDYSASDDGTTSLTSNNADDDADGWCGTTDYCKEVYTMAHLLGAPLAVVRVMIQHETDAHIQELGCEALACISNENCESGSILRIALMKIGALERALVAMKRFVAVPEIQKAACNLIGNMMGDSKTQARIVVSVGGLQAAISAMKNHVDCPMVQDYGCFVLRRLVEEGGQWATKLVVNAGGIGLVLQALAKHLQCKQVQMEGCMVLRRLAENDEADRTYRQKIIDAKGLIAVCETIRIHSCHDDGNRSSPIIVEAHKATKAIIS